jgi:CBS domain-containing protein
MIMQARDVMMRHLICTQPEASISQAARLMLQNHVSGLPVVDIGGNLVGVITEGDFLRRAETGTDRRRPRWLEFLIGPGKLASEYTASHGCKVAEVMSDEVFTATEDTPLDEIVLLMEHRRIKRLPVLRGRKLVGIVTRANLMRAVVGLMSAAPEVANDDASIRKRLNDEIASHQWAPIALINPIVKDGVVMLWGTIFDERQREALKVAAENIPGVKAVHDHLVWIEPVSGMSLGETGDVAAA